jgi:hypothetical protein
MTVTADGLGILGDLAKALGMLDASGAPEPAWFGDPGTYLGQVLADDDQRRALFAFVEDVLGGSTPEADPDGLLWVPLVDHSDPSVLFALVVDDHAPTHVAIGLGVRVSTTTPASNIELHVPVFRAAKAGQSVPSPLLLGEPGGRIRLTTDVTVDAGAPVAGVAHLGGIGLDLDLPTADNDPAGGPALGFVLRAHQ